MYKYTVFILIIVCCSWSECGEYLLLVLSIAIQHILERGYIFLYMYQIKSSFIVHLQSSRHTVQNKGYPNELIISTIKSEQ